MIFDGGREDWEAERPIRGAVVALAVLLLTAAAHPFLTPVGAWKALAATPIADYAVPAPWRPAHGQTLPVVPDPALTPGVIASIDQALVCATGDESYSRQHRRTSEVVKRAVEREYGAVSCGEIDHRIPLSLGGGDSQLNLWCQPGPPAIWTYQMKDKLEDLVWRQTCHEHQLTLAQAQAIFLEPDWRVPFCILINDPICQSLGKSH